MTDRELDLDALEKVANVAIDPPFPVYEAQAAFARTFTPATVLKLIALARPKAGGVEADDRVVQEMEYANSMRNMAAAFHAAMIEACELLAEKRHGNPARSPGHNARLCLESALAAAPEPLRVAGEEVERLRDMANMFSEGEDIMVATSVMREHAADLRSVLALITPDQPKQEVKDV